MVEGGESKNQVFVRLRYATEITRPLFKRFGFQPFKILLAQTVRIRMMERVRPVPIALFLISLI